MVLPVDHQLERMKAAVETEWPVDPQNISVEFMTQVLQHKWKVDPDKAQEISKALDLEDENPGDGQISIADYKKNDIYETINDLNSAVTLFFGEEDSQYAGGIVKGQKGSSRFFSASPLKRKVSDALGSRFDPQLIEFTTFALSGVDANFPQYLAREAHFMGAMEVHDSSSKGTGGEIAMAMAAGAIAVAIPSESLDILNQFDDVEKALTQVADELNNAIRLAEGELPLFPNTDPNFPWLDENLANEGASIRDKLYELREELKRVQGEIDEIKRAAQTLYQDPRALAATLEQAKGIVAELTGHRKFFRDIKDVPGVEYFRSAVRSGASGPKARKVLTDHVDNFLGTLNTSEHLLNPRLGDFDQFRNIAEKFFEGLDDSIKNTLLDSLDSVARHFTSDFRPGIQQNRQLREAVTEAISELDEVSRQRILNVVDEVSTSFIEAAHHRYASEIDSVTENISRVSQIILVNEETLRGFDNYVDNLDDIVDSNSFEKYAGEILNANLERATQIPDEVLDALKRHQETFLPNNPKWLSDTLTKIRKSLLTNFLKAIGIIDADTVAHTLQPLINNIDKPNGLKNLAKEIHRDYLKTFWGNISDISDDVLEGHLAALDTPDGPKNFKRDLMKKCLEDRLNIIGREADELLDLYGRDITAFKKRTIQFYTNRSIPFLNILIDSSRQPIRKVTSTARQMLHAVCRVPIASKLLDGVRIARDLARRQPIPNAIRPVVSMTAYYARSGARAVASGIDEAVDAARRLPGPAKVVAIGGAVLGGIAYHSDDINEGVKESREVRVNNTVNELYSKLNQKEQETPGYTARWLADQKKKFDAMTELQLHNFTSTQDGLVKYRLYNLVKWHEKDKSYYEELREKFDAMSDDEIEEYISNPYQRIEYAIYQGLIELHKREFEEILENSEALRRALIAAQINEQRKDLTSQLLEEGSSLHNVKDREIREGLLAYLLLVDIELAISNGNIDIEKLTDIEKAILEKRRNEVKEETRTNDTPSMAERPANYYDDEDGNSDRNSEFILANEEADIIQYREEIGLDLLAGSFNFHASPLATRISFLENLEAHVIIEAIQSNIIDKTQLTPSEIKILENRGISILP